MLQQPKPIVLIILDGWGYSKNAQYNAVTAANTPTWDNLWQNMPHTLISASGNDVGLPAGQMGNSEVGHMVMGAGRVIYQNYTRISNAIKNKSFLNNDALCNAVDNAISNDKSVHILGLLSTGGVHSHEDHIFTMIDLAFNRGARKIYLHAILDGRDTPPRSATKSLQQAESRFQKLGCGKIASVVGRYYSMDRDNRWDRIQLAYDMYTLGASEFKAETAIDALEMAYVREESDEFVKPTIISNSKHSAVHIEDGDAIIFMNFRSDRARQLTYAFTDKNFNEFERAACPQLSDFVMLTNYASNIKASCAYPPIDIHNSLGAYLADAEKAQLRIAETEKYAHVTFFFSGGQEDQFLGEDRILVPSPNVATYDLQPEMSAYEVTSKLINAIKMKRYDFIVCNFANGDMVGHTGDFEATKKAITVVDECLGLIVKALDEAGGECLITADHGNAEQMRDLDSGQPHTAHTSEMVPLIYCSKRNCTIENHVGSLADIAPTLLNLMGLNKPKEMTGKSMVKFL